MYTYIKSQDVFQINNGSWIKTDHYLPTEGNWRHRNWGKTLSHHQISYLGIEIIIKLFFYRIILLLLWFSIIIKLIDVLLVDFHNMSIPWNKNEDCIFILQVSLRYCPFFLNYLPYVQYTHLVLAFDAENLRCLTWKGCWLEVLIQTDKWQLA